MEVVIQMKKRRLLIFLAAFVMVSVFSAGYSGVNLFGISERATASASEEEAEEIFLGTVDVAAIYAFHPMMQYYDPKVDLFIKLPAKNTTYDDFLTVTQNRRNEFQKAADANSSEIKRLKGEMDVLNQEIQRLGADKAAEAMPVNEKFDKQIQSAGSEDAKRNLLALRTEELNKIEAKFDGVLQNKNKKMSDLLDSYEKIQRSLLKIYYLTPEETAEKFEEINNEIKEEVKIAAKKNGVKAVINFSLAVSEFQNERPGDKSLEEKKKINSELEELLSGGPDYSKAMNLLNTFDAKSLKNSDDETMKAPEHVKFLKQLSADNEKKNASKLFFSKKYLMRLKPIASVTSTPFIYGGTDLTWFTLISIMVRNGVPKEKAEAASEVISKMYYDNVKNADR